MSASARKQAWRVLELAARIAQEDERAGIELISLACTKALGYPLYEMCTKLRERIDSEDRVKGLEKLNERLTNEGF